MENLAEYYYAQLESTTNPGLILNKMYNDLFGTKTEVSRIKTFNKLIRLYGKKEVYFALLELAEWDKFDANKNPSGVISRFIINRLEKKYASRSDSYGVDLTSLVRKTDKLLREMEKEKLDIPETFHNGDNK